MNENFKLLGRRVKFLRMEKGISQTDMAEMIGLSQTNLSNMESGRTATTIQNLFKMREVLGCKMSDFFIDFDSVPVEKEEAFIESTLAAERAVMITAFDGDRIIGSADLRSAGERLRVRHRCGMGITILREYWSVGLGSAMMEAVIDCAKALGYEQLELDVVASNRRALGLYLKYGFKVYGCHPNKIRYADGTYADDYMMYKTL